VAADRRARRHPPSGLAAVVLAILLIGFTGLGAVLAADTPIKLALLPVGQKGSFFDLTMRAGEERTLQVDIANDGGGAIAARTYAADVYTIINGGFGASLRDQPRTGTTTWVFYPTSVVSLGAGERTRRSFTIAVPRDAGPGEYITSLVLENNQPILGAGAVGLSQIVRQAVAVVVTVPGLRSPQLAIGSATHQVLAGRSIVRVAVQNPGNVRLKPSVGFSLIDAAGSLVSQTTMQMDTFYARTNTFVEFPIATLLAPGTYTVRLRLDAPPGAHADAAIVLIVTGTPAVVSGAVLPDVIAEALGPWRAIAVVAGALIAIGLVCLIVIRRRKGHIAPMVRHAG
jgi:hypothetical protein